MAATTTVSMTADELERMLEHAYRHDLIRGVLHRMSPTGFLHHKVSGVANWLLGEYVNPRGLGVAGVEGGFVLALDPDTVLAPDAAFVGTERLPPEDQWDRFARLAPDLVVEVVSPAETAPEVEEKVAPDLAAGVPLVLVVDPRRRTVRVRTPDGGDRLLTEADELDGGAVLPGFRVPVARLFA